MKVARYFQFFYIVFLRFQNFNEEKVKETKLFNYIKRAQKTCEITQLSVNFYKTFI